MPANRTERFVIMADLENSEVYRGKGKREGTPGNYVYTYPDGTVRGGKGGGGGDSKQLGLFDKPQAKEKPAGKKRKGPTGGLA